MRNKDIINKFTRGLKLSVLCDPLSDEEFNVKVKIAHDLGGFDWPRLSDNIGLEGINIPKGVTYTVVDK